VADMEPLIKIRFRCRALEQAMGAWQLFGCTEHWDALFHPANPYGLARYNLAGVSRIGSEPRELPATSYSKPGVLTRLAHPAT